MVERNLIHYWRVLCHLQHSVNVLDVKVRHEGGLRQTLVSHTLHASPPPLPTSQLLEVHRQVHEDQADRFYHEPPQVQIQAMHHLSVTVERLRLRPRVVRVQLLPQHIGAHGRVIDGDLVLRRMGSTNLYVVGTDRSEDGMDTGVLLVQITPERCCCRMRAEGRDSFSRVVTEPFKAPRLITVDPLMSPSLLSQ